MDHLVDRDRKGIVGITYVSCDSYNIIIIGLYNNIRVILVYKVTRGLMESREMM